MIRVLQYIGGLGFGGSQAFIMEVYRRIDREKIQFDFVTFPNVSGGYVSEIASLGGRIFECPKYEVVNHRSFCKWWDNFLVTHPEYTIVHGHIRSSASVYVPICKKNNCVTIVHSHSTSNGRRISSAIKWVMQLPIRYQADFLFACSETAGVWLYGKKALNRNNFRIIPNGIDVDRFRYNSTVRDEVRQSIGAGDKFVIGHVGRFHEVKNHTFILRVFKALIDNDDNYMLLLLGDGELKRAIMDEALRLGMTNKVIFTGSVPDCERYYQAMDLFFFPSKWEGLPVSVIEAQASGLICLVSDTVTRNVQLTSLVNYMSLKQPANAWVNEIARYMSCSHARESDENIKRLKCFSSVNVTRQLQDFYLRETETEASK